MMSVYSHCSRKMGSIGNHMARLLSLGEETNKSEEGQLLPQWWENGDGVDNKDKSKECQKNLKGANMELGREGQNGSEGKTPDCQVYWWISL